MLDKARSPASEASHVIWIDFNRWPDVSAASRLVQTTQNGDDKADDNDDCHDHRPLADLKLRNYSASPGCCLHLKHPDELVKCDVCKVTPGKTHLPKVRRCINVVLCTPYSFYAEFDRIIVCLVKNNFQSAVVLYVHFVW